MELSTEAWGRWTAYRIAIKKPMRSQTEEAAKLKLMRFDKDQEAVVDQSIANGWTGLFPLPPEKTDPSAPKKRTRGQQEADNANWSYMNHESEKCWGKRLADNPILAKLQMASALLARYDIEQDQSSIILDEKRGWLKGRVAALVRECDNPHVMREHSVRCLVLRLFSDAGLRRLELRADAQIALRSAA